MNDFFNVLDDFELEEIAPAGEPAGESTFSLDVDGDASGEGEAAIDQVNEYNDDIDVFTEDDAADDGKVYVWDKDGNPFGGTSDGAVLGLTNIEFKTNKSGIEVGYVSLPKISSISFTAEITEAAPLTIVDEDLAMSGSANSALTMDNGTVTGGYFTSGTAWIAVQENYSTHISNIYNTDEEKVRLGVIGFADPEDEDDITFKMENSNLKSVSTTEDKGGSIVIEGDYDVGIDENSVKIRNAEGTYTVSYDDDGNIILNLSDLEAKDGTILTVVQAENIDRIIPAANTDSDNPSQIRIINETTTYTYTSAGQAYFKLADDAVTGFVFINENDSITLDNKSSEDFAFYDVDEDNLPLKVEDNAGQYTVKYVDGDYTVEVANSAKVTIGDSKVFDFTIKSGKAVTIKFTEDGTVESVDGLYNLADGDQVAVEGITATSATTGLVVLNSSGTKQYISTSGDNFTLLGGTTQQLQVEDGDTVYAVYDPVGELAGEGTIKDDISSLSFTSSGKGYYTYDSDDGITGFVFTTKGDSVTLPEDGEDITLYYQDTTTTFTVPLENSDGFKVTLTDMSDTDDPQFTISNITEGAIIPSTADPLAENFVAEDDDDEFTMNLAGQITAITNVEGEIVLDDGTYTIAINSDTFTYTVANDVTVTADDNVGLAQVTGLGDGDNVHSSDTLTAFVFTTDGDDVFTVNNKTYTLTGDENDITITAGGKVDGLDEGAELLVSAGPVTVNGAEYDEEAIANNDEIVGFYKKNGDLYSYIEDPNHPLFNENTTDTQLINSSRWLGLDTVGYAELYESTVSDLSDLDRSSTDGHSLIYLDDDNDDVTAKFNDSGKNVAVVTDTATGDKEIVLGNRGDAVIMQGTSEYGSVNIITGDGNDTIFVGGDTANDKVLLDANMKTVIDMGSEGVDKIHTYAAANANIILNNYDETSYSGVVIHDPEVPYIKDLVEAIQDGLLVFEDGGVTAIDRNEEYNGNDRKTRITVNNNVNSNHQTMIRLFGYRDTRDTYSDDFGQLVGFTGSDGGVLDASDIGEEVILIGNMNGDKLAGSNLKTGIGNDTIFAGAMDTIDTGDGVDVVILDKDENRDAATIIVGQGAGDAVVNLNSGFNGDVFDVTSYDGNLDYTFEEGILAIIDKSSKSSLVAETTVTGDFVEQTFINGSDILYSAIAKEGGAIDVTDDNTIVPNYYLAKDGAINFSDFSGEVRIDVDGEDNDWSGPNLVGSTENVTLGSSVNSLIGGSGTTIFKGGKGNETLFAGTGESSLYGAGGHNLLVGSTLNENKVESTEFFVIGIHNGAQNTITGFEFIADDATNQATFDNLNLGMADGNEITDIRANDDGSVSIAVKGAESGATEKVTIEGAAGNEFLVDRGTQFETVAQIAAKEVTVNNSYVDFYCATDDTDGATVKVGDIDATEIWLDAPDYGNGVDFSNSRFTVVDATGSNAEVLIAGNNIANTIIGGNGNASMWGGSGIVNDVMYGGSGHNEFYFEAYNGNDTIMSANNGDVIQLGVTLDQINFDGTNVTSTGVEIKLNDGSSLTLNSTAEVNIVLDDGTTARVNRTTQQFE